MRVHIYIYINNYVCIHLPILYLCLGAYKIQIKKQLFLDPQNLHALTEKEKMSLP